MRLIIILLLLPMFSWAEIDTSKLQSGDLIFQESRSRQSKAIKEATGSHWTHMGVITLSKGEWVVYEAVQPVKQTPLKRFLARGNQHAVKRVNPDFIDLSKPENIKIFRTELLTFFGSNYDVFFEWSDEKIYCSEFVWKGFYSAFGKSLGLVETFGDLNLEGPAIKKLIKERLQRTGRKLNKSELIITPVSIFNSEHLTLVGALKTVQP